MFDELYYLSAAEKCEIEKIEDIGNIQEVSDRSQKGASGKVFLGKIISVVSSEIYDSCVMCSSKLDSSTCTSTNIVKCDKCGAKMKENCKSSKMAKVIESKPTGHLHVKERFGVTIFDNILSDMVGGGVADVDLDSKLLDAPGSEFRVKNNIVYSAKQV